MAHSRGQVDWWEPWASADPSTRAALHEATVEGVEGALSHLRPADPVAQLASAVVETVTLSGELSRLGGEIGGGLGLRAQMVGKEIHQSVNRHFEKGLSS